MRIYSCALEREEFHQRIGGGIPYSAFVLISGEEGTGKSIICQRLGYGFLQNGVSVTYISTQYTTVDFLNQMNSLNYRITKNLADGTLRFVPIYSLLGEPRKREDFGARLMQAEKIFDNQITIVDSFSSLVKSSISSPEDILELAVFFKKLTASGKSVILTTNRKDLDENLLKELNESSTISIEVEIRKGAEEIRRIMTIKKYSGAIGDYIDITPFKVIPKVGLLIEISALV
jgi:flagellar protein FlaH